jgi:hypothetical protein
MHVVMQEIHSQIRKLGLLIAKQSLLGGASVANSEGGMATQEAGGRVP